LPDEVCHVEFVAVENVVFAERVVGSEGRIEPFLKFEVERKFEGFEATGALARDSSVDGSFEFQTSSGAPDRKGDVDGERKPKGCEVRQGKRFSNREFAPGL